MNQNGKMIAYCGLVCTDCEAYQATQAKDQAALERVSAHWRELFNTTAITAATVLCDGCLSTDGWKCSHCAECNIRACAIQHGVANCAHCSDFVCAQLESFLNYAPEARTVLNQVKAAL